MPMELPNEIWLEILKRVPSAWDWGRLQQVSKVFHAIIRDECWPQAKELKIKVWKTGVLHLSINLPQPLFCYDEKVLLLIAELIQKAPNMRSVHLEAENGHLPLEPFSSVLWDLGSMKIEKLVINSGDSQLLRLQSLAQFLLSISGTLKTLDLSSSGLEYSDQLLVALQSCLALETISLRTLPYPSLTGPFTESVLSGKMQLKKLKISRLTVLHVFDWIFPQQTFLNSRAQLSDLELNHQYMLFRYVNEIQTQGLAGNHPLKTIKTLTVTDVIGSCWTPRYIFPDLEQMKVLFRSFKLEDANRELGEFLVEYRDAPGQQRFLTMEVAECQATFNDLVGMPWDFPVTRAEQKDGWDELTFIQGNALTKVIIKRS